MSHANAALTPKARLKLARLIVDDGWPIARAAERYDVSWPTAKRWAERYRQGGVAGMNDRCSRAASRSGTTPTGSTVVDNGSGVKTGCSFTMASVTFQDGDRDDRHRHDQRSDATAQPPLAVPRGSAPPPRCQWIGGRAS